ncbi:SET domain-containing protein 9 [Suricata suricatta]|nr:SET domain-containing protein 9 [Suricata suricatta]
MPGRLLRGLWQRWRRYKYRFVPWIAMNLNHNPSLWRAEPQAAREPDVGGPAAGRGLKWARPRLVVSEDRGVLTREGSPRRVGPEACTPGVPRTVYQKHEPIFFQSIGNPFIFRCLDGVLIDGNDKGISKVVYRSCNGRDRLGPLKMSDSTWLTSEICNPLAVGQYVNNCSNDRAANVCYQEFDVPAVFPIELKQYLPNIAYSCDKQSPLRCVILVALRDISQGEELFSNYYTIVS